MQDLEILFPEQKLTIQGTEITVCEYSLKQQLQHRAIFAPFIDALRQSMTKAEADLHVAEFFDLLGEHYDTVLAMVALSINKPKEFVENLKGEDAEAVLMTWWAVNSDFFTRQAILPLLEKIVKNTSQNGERSLSPLWQTDTD